MQAPTLHILCSHGYCRNCGNRFTGRAGKDTWKSDTLGFMKSGLQSEEQDKRILTV